MKPRSLFSGGAIRTSRDERAVRENRHFYRGSAEQPTGVLGRAGLDSARHRPSVSASVVTPFVRPRYVSLIRSYRKNVDGFNTARLASNAHAAIGWASTIECARPAVNVLSVIVSVVGVARGAELDGCVWTRSGRCAVP